MSTAVLRAGLVVAAIVLGIFVLSKAFPTGQSQAPPVSEAADETTEPTDEDTGGGGGNQGPKEEETPQIEGVTLKVLNATDVGGLADRTGKRLEKLGYTVEEVGNALGSYDKTTIFYTKAFKADAQYLKETEFPQAELRTAGPDAPEGVDISIALGPDAA